MLLGKVIKSIVHWIDKKLDDKSGEPAYDSNMLKSNSVGIPVPVSPTASVGNGNNGMNFVVYGAIGGKVVEVSQYNPNTDRHSRNLYIITDKEDLGEEIGLIITKESLIR